MGWVLLCTSHPQSFSFNAGSVNGMQEYMTISPGSVNPDCGAGLNPPASRSSARRSTFIYQTVIPARGPCLSWMRTGEELPATLMA
jgi:hypothetical protein